MMNDFIKNTLKNACYEKLEDGMYCGTISGFRGVLAFGRTMRECKAELAEVLEEWTLVKISRGQSVKGLHFKPQSYKSQKVTSKSVLVYA